MKVVGGDGSSTTGDYWLGGDPGGLKKNTALEVMEALVNQTVWIDLSGLIYQREAIW
jgi:hypothetical protein